MLIDVSKLLHTKRFWTFIIKLKIIHLTEIAWTPQRGHHVANRTPGAILGNYLEGVAAKTILEDEVWTENIPMTWRAVSRTKSKLRNLIKVIYIARFVNMHIRLSLEGNSSKNLFIIISKILFRPQLSSICNRKLTLMLVVPEVKEGKKTRLLILILLTEGKLLCIFIGLSNGLKTSCFLQ